MTRYHCKKNGLLKVFAAVIKHCNLFWALTATKYVVLGFPSLSFLFANMAIKKIFFPFLRVCKEV